MSELDLLTARMVAAGAKRVYKVGAVPASPVAPYAVVSLSTGTPTSARSDGRSVGLVRSIIVQNFGPSWEAVTHMARYADAAFKDQPLTEFPGDPYCTRTLATDVIRDPDGEVLLYVLHTYRFKEQ